MYREARVAFVMVKERNIINSDSKCKLLLKISGDKSQKCTVARWSEGSRFQVMEETIQRNQQILKSVISVTNKKNFMLYPWILLNTWLQS